MNLSYDKANRLTGASGTGGFANYNESPIQYDANGNILNLTRIYNSVTIDQLAYKYNGNQLHRVDDTNNNEGQAVKGFINGANADNEMRYDGNGNLTADDNRGINPVAYNVLNLPRSLTRNGRTVQYTYDGAGIKLKSEAPDNVNTLYAGAFEYKGDGTLLRIGLEEGQLVKEGSSYVVQYYLRDHLGNVRSVLDENGNVIQETEYYAFGLPVQRTGSDKNKYLYNGKEKQPETEWLDYGARMYDPSIGRWMAVDPLADHPQQLRFSPYVFSNNNPLRLIDPDGRLPGDLYDQKGNKVGTDNVNDGKVYVVTDKKTVKDLKSSGGVVASAGAVNSVVELPSAFVRAEMGKAVDRSNSANDKRTDEFKGNDNEGGFHEEGGVYGTGANGEDKVVHAKPGSKTDPLIQGMATVVPSDPAISSSIAVDGSFHVHPSGTRSGASNCIGCSSGNFNQSPTNPQDYNEAKGYPKNSYVLGSGSGTVTIYNGNSTKPVATFPLPAFRKIGN